MQKNPPAGQSAASKTPQAPAAADTGGVNPADIKRMIDQARKDIPPNMVAVFDKVVLSGMRIMFDKSSHQMTLDALDKPGPLEQRIANGIIPLMYMLWTQSNKSIPPQLIVPATFVLTVRAFEFLLLAKDPEATKKVLGAAIELAITGIVERFKPQGQGAAPGQQPGQAPAPAAPAPQGGMLDAPIGGGNV